MRNFLRSWWRSALRRRGGFVAPRLERLESRIVFALPATPLPFTPFGTAHAAAFLATPNDFQLYRVHLGGGDVVNVAVSSQPSGGALQSNLRVFDATGRPLALDAQEGGDPHLTFQAPAAGDYLVGVSSGGDDAYNPAVANSGHGGVTTGLYALDLQRKLGAPLTPELAGGSFRLQTDTAAYGDTVAGTFTVNNRGGASAGAFAVQVVLSADDRFGPSSQVLTTFALAGLGAGQEFAPGGFTVTLPDLASATASGLPVSGPVYLGLRIDPAGKVPELNRHDQSGVHAGADWQALTVVTPITASGSNHSLTSAQALADLNSRVSGVLATGQTDWYQLTVPADGRLTATVTAPAGSSLVPRLTLASSGGQVLIQSDGSLAQHLPPGIYEVAVSAGSGSGRYQLTVVAVQTNAPFELLPSPPFAKGFVLADVNGDGRPDIITATPTYNTITDKYDNGGVSVLLGKGDGTFGPPQTFDGGSNPGSVVVADVNGDGKPDLIVDNWGRFNFITGTFVTNGNVSVLLGKGDGTFGPPQTFDRNTYPVSVAVADVNGDGKPDLVVLNEGTFNPTTGNFDNRGIQILLGKGDGTFGPAQSFAGGSNPTSVVVGDVNGDGKPDLVVGDSGKSNPTTGNLENTGVSIMLGNGDGTFQKPQLIPFNDDLGPVTVSDVNGDGKPDIITAGRSSGLVSLLLGNGDGTFQPAREIATFNATSMHVMEADVNGDGKPDIITYYYTGNAGLSGTISVLLGNGDGTFQKPQISQAGGSSTSGTSPWVASVAVADVNGDGKPDLADIEGYDGQMGVQLGNGDGTFQSPQIPQAFPAGAVPLEAVAVTDVNGDGKPDLITSGLSYLYSSGTPASLLLGNGDGTFQNPQTLPEVSGGVEVVDLNGDGKPDLINGGSVFLGNGDGTFHKLQTSSAAFGWVADVNGDCKPDIVTLNSSNFNPYDSSATATVSVLQGNGDGTFQPAREVASFTYIGFVGMDLVDVNGDGKFDIITLSAGSAFGASNTVSLLVGNGDGTFRPARKIADITTTGGVQFAVEDVNGDGKPDLITVGDTINVLLGNGDGTFQPARETPNSGDFITAMTDVNGDGKLDLITAGFFGDGQLSLLLGNGDGTFQPPREIANGDYTKVMAVADVNGDGRPDLITSGPFNGLRVLLDNADGNFTPVSPITAASQPNPPYLADLTGDGLPDSVVLNSAGAILFRRGLPGADNPFDPPIILNPSCEPTALR
jgi:hypothetical protein